jgi:YD repeat-containing protein
MKVKYFKDTDTALLEFSHQPIESTHELGENVYVDLDKHGNLVSMTIEHAQRTASLPSVTVEEVEHGAV